ncbi:hypothetical protein VPH35_072671 [Triticum aestivum]|uniref:probable galacturonosyltransferase 5 isoform X2 n=1 Tax=Triticum aestivum TaxID=4565 RepID=UPI001D011B27|nr:probable galacturonosyltransferase 5 isoform X2 [Triticum aestivum]
MKAGGGAGRREEAALWLWLLLIATACSFAFLLLNLPGGERTGRPQLSMKEIGEIARLDALPEEIEGQADEIAAEEDERISRSSPSTKEKIWMMQDQLIMARAYLQFASPHGNTHFVRELKLRMKEIERAISHSSSGSRVPGSTLQKMKAMELTLCKA